MMAKSVADGLVRAPFDGVVSEKMISPGEWVAPGKPLFTLVKDDPLKVDLSVPEIAIEKVKEGEHVILHAVSDPNKSYGATIDRLSAEIGRTRSLIVEAAVDKGSDLVPGMFVEADVVYGSELRVMLPKQALSQRGKQWAAFVVKNGEVEERFVHKGPEVEGGKVVILDGVAKGEKVVAKVPEGLSDGAKVTE
jgi:membrane fusion protein (multidrug efflux system)